MLEWSFTMWNIRGEETLREKIGGSTWWEEREERKIWRIKKFRPKPPIFLFSCLATLNFFPKCKLVPFSLFCWLPSPFLKGLIFHIFHEYIFHLKIHGRGEISVTNFHNLITFFVPRASFVIMFLSTLLHFTALFLCEGLRSFGHMLVIFVGRVFLYMRVCMYKIPTQF